MATMTLRSASFAANEEIPKKYTCEGAGVSPPLAWSDVPANARTLTLIVDDPDAPDPAAPKTTWVHWVVYNLPAKTHELPEGVTAKALPAGTRLGKNDFHRAEYGGPCPPIGRHRYVFKLYALDIELPLKDGATKADVERAMRGHIQAEAQLVGTYQKAR